MGGALSTLCTYLLCKELNHIKFINYTYGAPRVGNNKFCWSINSLNCECWSVVNNRDLVTTVPSIGYCSLPNTILLKNNKMKVCVKPNYNNSWWYNTFLNMWNFCINLGIADHSMDNYIANITTY